MRNMLFSALLKSPWIALLLRGRTAQKSGARQDVLGKPRPNHKNIVSALFSNKIAVMMSILLIISYFIVLFHYSVNIPIQDEYDAVLGENGLYALLHAENWRQFFHYLFFQQNEHRIMTTRVVELIQYAMNGQVNFSTLIIMGNLFRLGIIGLLFAAVRDKRAWPLFILLFFCLQLSDWECAFMGMCALAFYMVIFFALAAMASLHRSTKVESTSASLFYFILACIFSFLATFSNGNGLLVFFPGLALLAIQKHYRYFTLYTLLTVISISAYFYHFDNHLYPHVFNPFMLLAYTLIFLGSIIHLKMVAFFFGLLGLVMVAHLAYHALKTSLLKNSGTFRDSPGLPSFFPAWLVNRFYGYEKKDLSTGTQEEPNPLLIFWLLFIVLSAGIAAIDRVSFGLHQALASRYTIYSIVFFSILLIGYLNQGKKVGIVLSTLLLCIASINSYNGILHQKIKATRLLEYSLQHYDYPDQMRAAQIVAQIPQQKIYTPPSG